MKKEKLQLTPQKYQERKTPMNNCMPPKMGCNLKRNGRKFERLGESPRTEPGRNRKSGQTNHQPEN